MPDDILDFAKTDRENYQATDIFEWANNLLEFKGELSFELFFLSRKYIPYKTSFSKELRDQLEELFVDPALEYVLDGVEKGMTVRGFEEAESEQGVIQRTQLFKVPKAHEAFNWIRHQEHELENFRGEDHDFRRVKAIIARISHPNMKRSFYVVKHLPQSNIVRGEAGWLMRDSKFNNFSAEAVVRVPSDNQLLILDQDIYVFNQTKLKQVFDYDVKEASVAEKKVKEIKENFRLSLPEFVSIQDLVEGRKSIIKKLQDLDVNKVKQEDLLRHAEEIGLDLMEDNTGAIIIMDSKDLDKFVNLLNDDYIESPLTGEKYEIIKKKPLKLNSSSEE